MKKWADNTYWVETEQGELTVVSYDEDSKHVFEKLKATPVRQFPPCQYCPHIEPCMDSCWNEGNRMGGPSADTLSIVHTCNVCGDRVLTILDEGEKRKVPERCPRYKVDFGCALDCGACRQERQALREAAPSYVLWEQAAQALGKILGKFRKGSAETKDALKDVSEKMSRSIVPSFKGIPVGKIVEGQWVLAALVSDIQKRFPAAWGRFNEEMTSLTLTSWLEMLCVSLIRQSGSPPGVTRDFILIFTGRFATEWAGIPPAEKKFVGRVWEGLIRKALAQTEPSQGHPC